MKQYNWGIVGTGRISDTFCRALAVLPQAHISAVYSRTEEKGAAFAEAHGIDKVYTDLAKMCADDSVDIIYIGNPHPHHLAAALTAINAGKPVLCEKPMTLGARQSAELIDTARQNGVFLMEGMWTRFLPAVRKTIEWVESGAIGEVREVSSSFHIDRDEGDSSDRLFDPALGGGALLDLGVYPIFAVNTFLPDVHRLVSAEIEHTRSGVDRIGAVHLDYGQSKAHITFGFDYESCRATIIGTKGFIVVPDWYGAHAAYLYADGELRESFCEPLENGMKYEAQHVMECVERSMTESDLYPHEMTLREMRLCDEIRKKWELKYPNDGDTADSILSASAAFNADFSEAHRPLPDAPDWYRDSVFYHIYPLGMCGAPERNDFSSAPADRLANVISLVGHLASTGFSAVYFGPVFESGSHGYDTADYRVIDRRLGTNVRFAELCRTLHSHGMRVVLDGVFNHVGRDFWAFRDVREKKWDSPYRDWFNLSFDGNSNFNDGFWYEGWEGCYDLVKLNLRNHEVRRHIFDCILGWIDEFGIDGLRLDVAYLLDEDFIRELRSVCRSAKSDFFLMGECIHGDYRRLVNDSMLDSVTNYECYKGIYSSVNNGNMHEIGYSLHRQFGQAEWCLYRGMSLYTFVDNHDVTRIASVLTDRALLPVVYALEFAMPGIPSVYYGSELAMTGDKKDGDASLRPALSADDVMMMRCPLTDCIARLCSARAQSKALCRGDYHQLYVQPKQLMFDRCCDGERVVCVFNTDSAPHTANLGYGIGSALDLITGQTIEISEHFVIPARTAYIARVY